MKMNTTEKRLGYLDNKIREHEQLIELYKKPGFNGNDMISEINYHRNLIKYLEKRKVLIIHGRKE